LAEIVSEPDLESSTEAYDYLISLKGILRAVGVSECDMEKGQLRCDANVSVRKKVSDPLGKRVEIKNLNSFKAVKAAIEHEAARQSAALEKGEALEQETRLWDDDRQKTFVMRSKEEAHDYRYFPEPDLVPFSVKKEEIRACLASLPELPKAKMERFRAQYSLSAYDAGVLNLDKEEADFFEACVKRYPHPKTLANWMTGPVAAYLNVKSIGFRDLGLKEDWLIGMAEFVESGAISFQAAKEKLFPEVVEQKKSPRDVMREKGLEQVSDQKQLEEWIARAILDNPKVVADFKSGKDSAAMFLVGQVMKKSQGKANPIKVKELMTKKLTEIP
jgi:aspartyl-tRNA(Asn)/glutamyl-tRNA(Gln) amidotransferase subunit B